MDQISTVMFCLVEPVSITALHYKTQLGLYHSLSAIASIFHTENGFSGEIETAAPTDKKYSTHSLTGFPQMRRSAAA